LDHCGCRSTSTRRSRSPVANAWHGWASPKYARLCPWLQRPRKFLFFIVFFIVWGAIGVVACFAGFADGLDLGFEAGFVLGLGDLVEFGGIGLELFAQAGEVVGLLPDDGKCIGLYMGLRPCAFGEPVQQIARAVLDGLGVGDDGIVPIDAAF